MLLGETSKSSALYMQGFFPEAGFYFASPAMKCVAQLAMV